MFLIAGLHDFGFHKFIVMSVLPGPGNTLPISNVPCHIARIRQNILRPKHRTPGMAHQKNPVRVVFLFNIYDRLAQILKQNIKGKTFCR
jgi:hypothetical protein